MGTVSYHLSGWFEGQVSSQPRYGTEFTLPAFLYPAGWQHLTQNRTLTELPISAHNLAHTFPRWAREDR